MGMGSSARISRAPVSYEQRRSWDADNRRSMRTPPLPRVSTASGHATTRLEELRDLGQNANNGLASDCRFARSQRRLGPVGKRAVNRYAGRQPNGDGRIGQNAGPHRNGRSLRNTTDSDRNAIGFACAVHFIYRNGGRLKVTAGRKLRCAKRPRYGSRP